MFFINSTGLFASITLFFWFIILPFIYPTMIEKFLHSKVLKSYLYFFWNFYVSFTILALLLIIYRYIFQAIAILLVIISSYIVIKRFNYSIYNLIASILRDNGKTIAYFLFISALLSASIALFYSDYMIAGVILYWTVVFNISTTYIGLLILTKAFRLHIKKLKNIFLND